jgi:Fe-S oxidoreductase
MPGNLPKRTSRGLLDIEDDKVIPVIRNPKTSSEESEAVFYFPGCGSERLFSQVGLATQAMLYEIRRHHRPAARLSVLRLPANLVWR